MSDHPGRETASAAVEGRHPPYPPGVIATISRGEIDDTVTIFHASVATPWGSRSVLQRGGTAVARSRNNAVESAGMRVPNWGWILFVDSDHKIREEHYETVVRRFLDWQQPIVSATVCRRSAPFKLNAFTSLEPTEVLALEDLPDDGLVKVQAVGMGFCLIRREVFDALPRPWFRSGQWAPDIDAEDLYLTNAATQRGFGVYVDAGLEIGHNFRATVWPGRRDRRPYIELEGDGDTWLIPVFPRRGERGL